MITAITFKHYFSFDDAMNFLEKKGIEVTAQAEQYFINPFTDALSQDALISYAEQLQDFDDYKSECQADIQREREAEQQDNYLHDAYDRQRDDADA